MSLSEITKRLIPCLNPLRIENPHTHDLVMVGCGKCYQCLNIKAFVAKKACDTEALHHRYCFFVTPSYSEENLPRLRLEPASEGVHPYKKMVLVIDDCERSSTYGECITSIPFKEAYKIQRLRYNRYKHFQSPIAYALKTDLQKYIKRLRYYVYKETGERIRYYAVSDYGGKYLRPHFHLLFYFDKQKTYEIFSKLASEHWKLGGVNCSLCQGNASSYVSSYVTSTSRRFSLYNHPAFKVRAFHSVRFGFEALYRYRDDIYNLTTLPFNGNSYTLPFGLASFYGTSAIERAFFPKIYGFGTYARTDLFNLYRLYSLVCRNRITSFRGFLEEFQVYLDSLPDDGRDYMFKLLDCTEEELYMVDKYLSRLMSIYYVGKKFHRQICQCDPANHRKMFDIICRYYELKDQDKFTKFYECFEREADILEDDIEFAYPYTFLDSPDDFEDFKERLILTDAYSRVYTESFNVFDFHIKRKKYSDIRTNGLI